MDITPEPVRRLKRLRLGGLLPTLPDRFTHARQSKLGHGEFLELLLQDEIDRRDSQGLTLRLVAAGFDEAATVEQTCALGHSACRAGHRVRFVAVAKLLQALHQSRADNSFDRELRSWLAPDLLILDDFGLRKLTAQQSSDFYDVLVERHRRAATIITSNRAVDEWVALFDDPILANSALDRFAHRAHQIVMEGPSLRAASASSPPRSKRHPAPPAAAGG